jgi:hypothetical protein
MANAIVEIPNLPSGQTLTADLVDLTSDTAVESAAALTERTNAKTRYRWTHTGEATGWHVVVVKLGGTVLGGFVVNLENADGVYYAGDAQAVNWAAVWAYATRTLTQPAAQVADLMEGSTLTLTRGISISFSLTGLGNLTGRSKLWITGKATEKDTDSAANFQIEETDGLLRIGGEAPVSDDGETGTIEVTDQVAGNVTVTISAAAAYRMKVLDGGVYNFKWQIGDDFISTEAAELNVNGNVTQRIS